eukprot:4539610-Amphidinium_carterae.1
MLLQAGLDSCTEGTAKSFSDSSGPPQEHPLVAWLGLLSSHLPWTARAWVAHCRSEALCE